MSIYLRYVIRTDEPLRIADDSSSQHGQTMTLRYIPGSTIRGMVINKLAKNKERFEEIKKKLFSEKTAFLNAYPLVDGKELLPSPKGFYEDKTIVKGAKPIKNVVIDGEMDDGWKRAGLGDFSDFTDDVIRYYSVNTVSDMRITRNTEKKDVFRHEMIERGCEFSGYILCVDESVAEFVKGVFGERIYIGNARTSGIGRCDVIETSSSKSLPYEEYLSEGSIENECYLYLLSDMTMRSEEGEYVGIDTKVLEEKLGVNDLSIRFASSTVRDVRGYNRNWGGRIPSVAMYEKGSIFHLSFSGTITPDRIKDVIDSGIGVRKNEGFGRVLIFDKSYEKILSKEALVPETDKSFKRNRDEGRNDPTLRIVAVSYLHNLVERQMEKYITNIDSNALKLPSSQRGKVDEICVTFRYDPGEGRKTLTKFFGHALEKEQKQNIQKQKKSKTGFREFVFEMLDHDFYDLLGIKTDSVMGFRIDDLETKEWVDQMRLRMISQILRYENKKEV